MDKLKAKLRKYWGVVGVVIVVFLGALGFYRMSKDDGTKLNQVLQKGKMELELLRKKADLEIEAINKKEDRVLEKLERSKNIKSTEKRLEELVDIRNNMSG